MIRSDNKLNLESNIDLNPIFNPFILINWYLIYDDSDFYVIVFQNNVPILSKLRITIKINVLLIVYYLFCGDNFRIRMKLSSTNGINKELISTSYVPTKVNNRQTTLGQTIHY